MLEIVIPKPEYSQYPQSLRRYSADRPGDLWHKTYFLRRHKVTPQTHPLAADLFAGDGSMAWHLCNLGWRRENITCFDKVVTPTPLVEGVNWRYWDLRLLINALLLDNPLPENVQAYRGYFDVVMVVLGDYRTHLEELVAKFLTKPGGKYFF